MSAGWAESARRLARELAGSLYLPGEAGYAAGSAQFNKRYAGVRPAAVASVADVDDVRRVLTWAHDQGIAIIPRSGGHSYGGFSTGDGLVVDLRRLDSCRADPSTGLVTVGGGASMAAVYRAIEPHQMSFALGNSPTVGIGGLVLGGGVAAASRKLGLTCDALVETTLVTADGEVLTCNSTENADLFWACRGGGGGNFGINVSFTFQAQPVGPAATCLLLWNWSDGERVLPVLQEIVQDAPDEFSARLGASATGTGGAENKVISAVGQHLGPASELADLLDPVLSLATPIRHDLADRTFWQARDYLQHETCEDRYSVRTNYATGPLPDRATATMLSLIERWPGSLNTDGGGVGMFAWGGQINRVPRDETAFWHRDSLFLLSMDTAWTADDPPAVVDANLRWLDELYDAMAEHLSGFAYQNFIDPGQPNWEHAYYGPNYPRLQTIKRTYDPDRLFRFDQAITPLAVPVP